MVYTGGTVSYWHDISDTSGVWGKWITGYSTMPTTSSCTSDVWVKWTGSSTMPTTASAISYASLPVKSKKQMEIEKKQAEETMLRIKEERRKRVEKEKLVEQNALQLLKECLDAKQLEELEKTESFFFIVDDNNWFKIMKRRSHNIYHYKREAGKLKPIRSICRHVEGSIHNFDNMTAQLLELGSDYEGFIRKSNVGYDIDRNLIDISDLRK